MPETGQRVDPFRAFNFLVDIQGIFAGFHEATLGSFTIDPVEYREGTDIPLHVRKLTGLRKFANITLKRGFTQNYDMWKWYAKLLGGQTDRRDGSMSLQDELHKPVVRWEFKNGWISKWEGPAFNATANNVAIESVELTVEEITLVTG
jgi:phage tail-like protein